VSFDRSALLPSNNKSPAAQPDRPTTNAALDALLRTSLRPTPCDVFGPGPLLLSDIPPGIRNSNTERGVILGIDEAGRGPTLGPMTYAAAFWHPDSTDIPSGFNDSKQLSAEKRASLLKKMQSSESIGFVLRVLHASEISRNMLRKVPYSLNAMSHDAAIEMIWAVLDAGVKIDTCFIDTVGTPESYRRKLESAFQGKGMTFVVETKADAKYAPCSAASVVAKESRDTIIDNWNWTEKPNYIPNNSHEWGSGYPSDPKCKSWLKSNTNMDAPFGFPDYVRFSWAPAKNALKEGAENSGPIVKWEADEDEEDNQPSLNSFVVGRKTVGKGRKIDNLEELRRKKSRLGIFNELGLSKVMKFAEAAY